MEKTGQVISGPQNVIEDAANDPRFDTFWKRLNWFRVDQTDEEFAESIGVDMALFTAWKGGKPLDEEPISLLEAVAKYLDVSSVWLTSGIGHRAFTFPDGKRRLTSIPQFETRYQFVDTPDDNEPRSCDECFRRQAAAMAVR